MGPDLEYNYEECLAKNPNYNVSDLNELREWLNKQDTKSIIPKDMHDKQLLIFYNAGQMSIEATKKCIKAYYELRDNTPEFFDNRELESPKVKSCLRAVEYYILPETTEEGYGVMFHRLHNFEPENYHMNESCKLYFMTIDGYLHKYGPRPGYIFLFDLRGVKFSHIPRCSITAISKFCQYIQNGLPVNIKGFHILNSSPIIDKILFLLKPFLKKEIFNMIQVHSPDTNMENFYKDYIPKYMLPPDFGGTTPDTQTLHNQNTKLLQSLKSYFDLEEKHRHLYKKSKKKSKVDDFQNLSID